jgi:hypothetical protein
MVICPRFLRVCRSRETILSESARGAGRANGAQGRAARGQRVSDGANERATWEVCAGAPPVMRCSGWQVRWGLYIPPGPDDRMLAPQGPAGAKTTGVQGRGEEGFPVDVDPQRGVEGETKSSPRRRGPRRRALCTVARSPQGNNDLRRGTHLVSRNKTAPDAGGRCKIGGSVEGPRPGGRPPVSLEKRTRACSAT